jgi:hypothetical protein
MSKNVDNRYRKAAKKLREIERLKNKVFLTEEERNKIDNELHLKLVAKKLKRPTFSDLPEEVLNIIVAFLPINRRLAILRYKYSNEVFRQKLKNLPTTNEITNKLYYLAKLSYEVTHNCLDINSSTRHKIFPYALTVYKLYKEPYYPEGYTTEILKQYFSDLIMTSIEKYVKIYKSQKKNKFAHILYEYIETRMFNILKNLTVMDKYYLK